MTPDELRAKFRLIHSPRRVAPEEVLSRPSIQAQLFPTTKDNLLVFITFPKVSDDEFTRVLEILRPQIILELRRLPRFDIGQLNRKRAFGKFNALQSKYLDLAASLSPDDDLNDPVDLVRSFLSRQRDTIKGPVMFLVNVETGDHNHLIVDKIMGLFAKESRHVWEAVNIPHYA